MAKMSYQGVHGFYPMMSPYDRQLCAEHILATSHLRHPVQVEIGADHWVVQRSCGLASQWPKCGGALFAYRYLPTKDRVVCVRCAIEDSVAGTPSAPVRRFLC
jgi:hypothetical protein